MNNATGIPFNRAHVHGVLGTAAGVDLEGKHFVCHIHHVLIPEVVRNDIHYLRTFGCSTKPPACDTASSCIIRSSACWAAMLGVPVVNQLKGALSTHGADQACLLRGVA